MEDTEPGPASPRGADVIAGGPRLPDRRSRWHGLPPRHRRAVRRAAAAGTALAALAGTGVLVEGWRSERAARDALLLHARLGVTVSSTTTGGRVDYHLSLRNRGERAVRVRAVDLAGPRLRGRVRGLLPTDLPGAAAVDLPLSVRLDCAAVPADRAAPADPPAGAALRVVVTAVPQSGRQRAVRLTAQDARVLTGPAATLCRVRPGLRGEELSGPVRSGRPGRGGTAASVTNG